MKLEERNIEYDERINRYLRGLMGDDERTAFEQEVDGNEELRERLISTSLLVQGIVEEGMQREGQFQLDTISQMSPEEFEEATMEEQLPVAESANKEPMAPKRSKSLFWWVSGLAASIALVVGLFLMNPTTSQQPSVLADNSSGKTPMTNKTITAPARPTLASLAKEYNRPIAGEPDEFVAIRQQIQNEDSKEEMMAIVYDIDKIEAPTYTEGPMGAENAEVIKETQLLHNDCARWYKAIAYLKANDKASAIEELDELVKHSKNQELVNRASALLMKLKR